jgi:hypothetical protein
MANKNFNEQQKTVANARKVITGVTRLSYCNLNAPKSINGGEARYSASVLIPKTDKKTLDLIEKAVKSAYDEGKAKLQGNGKSCPSLAVLKTPLRDGDEERPDDEAYQGHYFLNANNREKPGIVDANRDPIYDSSEIYSGIYARCSLSFYAFNSNGNKGIACALNHVQKLKDGEPLGGRTKAEDDFNDGYTADEEDDFLL